MSDPRPRVLGLRLLVALVGVIATWTGAATAGGHHGQLVYLPVAAAPATVVAAAPTYSVVAASPLQRLKYAMTPSYQVVAAPVAYQTAAAPVAYQAAAAPTYYQATAAAAAPTYYYQAPAASAAPPAKAAGAPAAAAAQYFKVVNGYLVPVTGAGRAAGAPVAGAPGDAGETGRLSVADYQTVVSKLKDLVTSYSASNLAEADLRELVVPRAQDLYADYAGIKYEDFSDDDRTTVNGLIDAALGKDSATPATPATPNQAARPQTQATQGQVPMQAAPMQLFLPYKLKHHHLVPIN